MMMTFLFNWLNELYTHWQNDRVANLSAALAYYTIFSLAPILLLCISIAGILFDKDMIQSQLIGQMSGLIGKQTALEIQDILQHASHQNTAIFAQIISVFLLLFSASGVFSEIQGGLNIIWGVRSNPNQKWYLFFKNRFLSLAMVLISAFLLLVSLVLTALLTILSNHLSYFIGGSIWFELIMSYCFSFFVTTLLFAMMFKQLPDVVLQWNNVWIGAVITSLLFSVGKIVIGIYLNKVQVATVFGAAGSFIVLLIWVYYSAQIFFIGAEITKIYSNKKELKTRLFQSEKP